MRVSGSLVDPAGEGYPRLKMGTPELSVVCRNCGSEVSPYVTECPYCGTRLRKRAPKLEREGDEIKVREGRRERRLRKSAERRERRQARAERRRELRNKPLATGAVILASAVTYVLVAATSLGIYDLGAVVGPVGDEVWRYAAAPFVYDDAGYLFVCGVAIAIFLPPVERRFGALLALLFVIVVGAVGALAAERIAMEFGDGLPLVAGGNAIALGLIAAYVVAREPARRAHPENAYDPIAVGVAATVVLLLPLFDDMADPWAALAGAILAGLVLFAARRRTPV